MADPIPLPDLIAALTRLDGLTGVDRARLARELELTARASIGAAGDLGVWQATREEPASDVARQLGVTVSRVEAAITRHRARTTVGHFVRRSRAAER